MKRSAVSVFICIILLHFCHTQSKNQSEYSSKLERSFQRNKIRGFILERAERIAAGKYLGGCVGYECEQPDESIQYTFISQFANFEELNELLYHPSGLVRCYALDALIEKGKVSYYQILKEKLSDESEVLEAHGCELFPIKVRDYYYNRLSDKISKSEKKEIDMLILKYENASAVKKSLSEEKHKSADRKK